MNHPASPTAAPTAAPTTAPTAAPTALPTGKYNREKQVQKIVSHLYLVINLSYIPKKTLDLYRQLQFLY